MQRRHLDAAQVEVLQRMDPQSELMDELPRLFAEDLNAAMALEDAPERVVLFFDTHEAFWGQQRDLAAHAFFQRDEWLRLLVGSLDLSAGIVVVIAGRDRPRWAEATRVIIPKAYVDERLVGHPSEADAGRYLERAGISDPAMHACLISWARVAPDQVHPHYLGLCADVVLAASRQGLTLTPEDFRGAPQVADKGRELLDRLLSYVGADVRNAVHALSACRAFDREIYSELGDKLGFQATKAGFTILTQFSFVWRAERRGEDWYRIHDLVRRLLDEAGDTMTREAHQAMKRYYRRRAELGEGVALVEAIYHLNRLDWERGVDEWAELFDKALELSRYGLCRALLEVRSELSIETNFSLGRVSRREGDYFASLARHDEAKQEYLEAIAASDVDLRLAPNNVAARGNKGMALLRLGEVQAALAEQEHAVATYYDAIAAYDAALTRAPDQAWAHFNKGLTLRDLGVVQLALSRRGEAIANLRAAFVEFSRSVEIAPGDEQARTARDRVQEKLDELSSE
jgi:tetratricopeptide (TPR) repeat protein